MYKKIFTQYKELFIGIVFALLASAYLIGSLFIRKTSFVAIGAEFMPQIYGGVVLLLSLLQIIQGVKLAKSYRLSQREVTEEKETDSRNVAITYGLIIFYIASMELLGFIISSGIFLFFLSSQLTPGYKKKNYIVMLVFSVLMPIIVNYLFKDIMHLALPTGFLGI